MTDSVPPTELAKQAAKRAAQALQTRHRADGPAVPGDVLILPTASDQPVQWVVLARDPSRPDRLLIAAVDAGSLVGSADLPIGQEALGPLVLRRPYGGWLAAERLNSGHKAGTLRLDQLQRAREHWFQDPAPGSVLAQEVDDDPEYRHWLQTVVQPAHRQLFESESERRPTSRPGWPSIAAAILLGLGGLLLWLLHQQQTQRIERERERVEERLAKEIEKLQTDHREALDEQRRLLETYEEQLADAAGDPGLQSTLRELRDEIQEAWASVAVVNPAIQIVGSAMTRGRVTVELPEGSSHAVLLLKLDGEGVPDGTTYRLDLLYADADEVLWSLDGLEAHSLGELKVGLPAKMLEKGFGYDIRLIVADGSETEAGFYQIRIP